MDPARSEALRKLNALLARRPQNAAEVMLELLKLRNSPDKRGSR